MFILELKPYLKLTKTHPYPALPHRCTILCVQIVYSRYCGEHPAYYTITALLYVVMIINLSWHMQIFVMSNLYWVELQENEFAIEP